MRILMCHNFYMEPGGEDLVFADEGWLLESHGHEVIRYTRHNDDIEGMGGWNAARATLWNRRTLHEVRKLIRQERPELLHCHNTFPLISPSIYTAANEAKVPVVQTLHNFRLLCPSALFLRNGRPCEDCLGKLLAWPGIVHRCYRRDRAATAVVAGMLAVHRLRGTWTQQVQQFIALSEFSRQKFVEGGLPPQRLAIKANSMRDDPGCGGGRGDYAIFIGRLAVEKGLETLLAAWQRLREPLILKIVGDGPLADQVRAAAVSDSRIEFLGHRSSEEVLALLGDARCLLTPSICYENCPKSLIEAYAKGTPVIASRLGAMLEMVEHGRTGLFFEAGNADDLARSVEQLGATGGGLQEMRLAARGLYEQKYCAEKNYSALMDIYSKLLSSNAALLPQAVHRETEARTPLCVKPHSKFAGIGRAHAIKPHITSDAAPDFPRRVLLCHNFYQEPGGEDQVFADEGFLLESFGHEVLRYSRHNDEIAGTSRWQLARATLWSRRTLEEIRKLIRQERPDVVHCHNTFPLISPSIYTAAREAGVPVVQTLHNFRLLCPSALLLRKGRPCEDCMGKLLAWPGIVHRCYRRDRAATAVVVGMLAVHRLRGTWVHQVQQFIALSEFSRRKFIEGGLPAGRLAVKANFMRNDPGYASGGGGYAIFVGRLAPEKGVATLLAAWQRLKVPMPLKIVGDGPLASQIRAGAASDSRIELLGRRSPDEVLALLGNAEFLLMPSLWYENCPKTIIEAYAKGTPVIGSRLGAIEEMVEHGRTGMLFEAGNADDLAHKIAELTAPGTRLQEMRSAARNAYEQKYSAAGNYAALMEIYRRTLGPNEGGGPQTDGRANQARAPLGAGIQVP